MQHVRERLDTADMRRVLSPILVLVVAGVLASAATAAVHVTKRPARASGGDTVSVTIRVSPRARCTIGVYYSTRRSEARGLVAKTGTTITWTWQVGSSTKAGTWPVKIDCGKSGRAQVGLVVR